MSFDSIPAWVMALVVAPFAGSFIGVLILRLPDGRPVVFGRSRCDRCGTALTFRDMIPLFSYAAQRGRCRHCGVAIGWFYPAVEIAALCVASSAVVFSPPGAILIDCILGWTLVALAWIDTRTYTLPDVLTLPLIAAGIGQAWFLGGGVRGAIIGAVAGFGILFLLQRLYRAVRHREGIGLGDAKLLAVAGAWLGPGGLPYVLLAASVLALIAAGIGHLFGVKIQRDTAIPFGPFLALGIWVIRLSISP
jgi:leader peptidase (prepilin peptidase)/N-methyltransferase